MDTVTIGDEKYVIMKRSEYVDVCQAFIDDGMERERLSRVREDDAVLCVLRFYGSVDNYVANVSEAGGKVCDSGFVQCDLSNVCADNGQKARDTIDDME